MADVEKLNINSTDYDIADAKALRNKDTAGSNSFIDTRAGTAQYPTTEAHTDSIILGKEAHVRGGSARAELTILGNGAYANMSYSTVVGNMAHANGSQTVSVGYNANAGDNLAIAIGSGATINSGKYSIIIGSGSGLSGQASIVMGYATSVASDASIALGRSTTVGANSSGSVAIGYNATVSNYCSYSLALGYNARATSTYAAQIGEGTNSTYGTLQFRDWQLLDSNGKIPVERLPDGIKTATPQSPNLYDIDEEKVSEQAILYTGVTNSAHTNSQFYRGRVRYGYPHFACDWVDSDWLDSRTDVMIDQQKFFTKLAEVTKQRIDDDDIENGVLGGDNAEMSIYLKYDADNDYYFLDFDSDSFEAAFNHSPDDITGLSFDDLADYGIYFRNFHKPSDLEGEYEFCDIYYYAPVYINGYDWSNSPSYVNYLKFLEGINDNDWGIGVVVPNDNDWEFEIDGTYYSCPIIPKTYEWNGNEYDGVEFRWEWNDNDEKWIEYINGEKINYSYSTADLYSTFGIYVEPGEEENVEYINLYVRGGEQRYWQRFDPVNSANFCTKQEKQEIQSDIALLQTKSIKLIQTDRDLNTFIQSGVYHIQAIGCTNLPSTASISRDMFLFVTSTNDTNVKQVLITDYVNKSQGSFNRGTYCSNMYVRTLAGGIWRSWVVILTPEDLLFLPGFDETKKQVIGHLADTPNVQWIDAE